MEGARRGGSDNRGAANNATANTSGAALGRNSSHLLLFVWIPDRTDVSDWLRSLVKKNIQCDINQL